MNITEHVMQLVAAFVTLLREGKYLTPNKPQNYRAMLSIEADAKTSRSVRLGYLTGILYLAPHRLSGVINTCVMASMGCIQACLFTAGRAAFSPWYQAS